MQFFRRLFTEDTKVYLFLLLYSTIILFFISPDSYTHDLFFRCDSAIFFTCGKAWMNGMIPYVDFADSKGPLLWLIYGIGYLISHYDYVGVFWLSCLFYSVAFYFCYEIGKLFFQETNKSLMVALFMALPFFNAFIHYEIRAEDFCQPFICGSMYFMLKQLMCPDIFSKKSSFYLGFSIMACLLIKWNIALLLLSFFGVYYIQLWKNRHLMSGVLWTFCGMLLVATPFIIYFYIEGNFMNFIEEYFVNTVKTVHNGPSKKYFVFLFYSPINTFIHIIYLSCSFYIIKFYKRLWYWPFSCCLFSTIMLLYKCCDGYYFQSTSIFGIIALIILVKFIHLKRIYSIFGIFIASCIILYITISFAYDLQFRTRQSNLFFQPYNKKEYYEVARIINQIKSPKIFFNNFDYGIGVPCGVLPACKYWTLQNGATQEMTVLRRNAIINKKPDFIIVSESNVEFQKFVNECGYQYYSKCFGGNDADCILLYGRPGLNTTIMVKEPSSLDILLKRRIIK